MGDSITRLYRTAKACRRDDPSTSRTARLLRSGRGKIAKKFAEEAVEVVIDTVQGGRDAIVKESADLIYNLVVLWISERRQPQLGFAGTYPRSSCELLERMRAAARERHQAVCGCRKAVHEARAGIDQLTGLFTAKLWISKFQLWSGEGRTSTSKLKARAIDGKPRTS
jgi:phosphoribosyl-ATP pyrophosphohydrolase